MKCPLFVLAKTAHYSENVMITTDCLKEECGWWIPQVAACSMHIGVDLLGNLVVHLKDIAKELTLVKRK